MLATINIICYNQYYGGEYLMSEINPYWDKVFYTVARARSFTKASEELELKKSTVRRHINLLEDELKTTLFYRDNKGVSLTPDGKEYFEYVEKALNYLKAGEKLIKSNNDIETGEIVIGALSHISHFFLMERIKILKLKYPNLKITLVTGATGNDLMNLLENHKIDFAIDSTSLNIKNKDIQKEELKKIENIFISNVPLEIKDLKELEKLNLILGLDNTITNQDLFETLRKNNVTIKPSLKIDITELKIDATRMGLGIAYVMREAVKRELENKELYEVKLPIKLPYTSINLLYLKGQLTSIDNKFIKEYLKK